MHIGGDIVDEILSRLPVKSLIRFKVVCKDWYLHIHSECFIAKHIKNQRTKEKTWIYHHNLRYRLDFVVTVCSEQEKNDEGHEHDETQTLFHQEQQYCIKDMPFDYLRDYEDDRSFINLCYNKYKYEDIQLIGTCNGLVCLVNADERACKRIITLWNPATRDFKTLPSWEPQRPTILNAQPTTVPDAVARMECLQLRGDHNGFGFDSTSNDYKVMRLAHFYDKRRINQAAIYSLSTNSWKELDYSNVSAVISRVAKNGGTTIFLGDKVYWVILSYDMMKNEVLLSFDMGKEVFQFTSLPSEYMALAKQFFYAPTSFFALRDSVALVLTTKTRLEIWSTKELEQGHASWIKVLNIDYAPGISRPLGFWKHKNSNDDLFLFTHSYNGKDKDEMKGTYVKDRDEIKNDNMMTIKVKSNIVLALKLVTYIETLVPINRY